VFYSRLPPKGPRNKQKTQETGQPHQAIKGFISGRNFHNIRRQLDKKQHKACEINNNELEI